MRADPANGSDIKRDKSKKGRPSEEAVLYFFIRCCSKSEPYSLVGAVAPVE